MKIPISPKIRQKFAYSKFLLIKTKKIHKGPDLTCFYDCANFQVNRSIRPRSEGGQNSPPPPPHPMDSSPQNNPMALGLRVNFTQFHACHTYRAAVKAVVERLTFNAYQASARSLLERDRHIYSVFLAMEVGQNSLLIAI